MLVSMTWTITSRSRRHRREGQSGSCMFSSRSGLIEFKLLCGYGYYMHDEAQAEQHAVSVYSYTLTYRLCAAGRDKSKPVRKRPLKLWMTMSVFSCLFFLSSSPLRGIGLTGNVVGSTMESLEQVVLAFGVAAMFKNLKLFTHDIWETACLESGLTAQSVCRRCSHRAGMLPADVDAVSQDGIWLIPVPKSAWKEWLKKRQKKKKGTGWVVLSCYSLCALLVLLSSCW